MGGVLVTARLVAVGQKKAAYPTLFAQYSIGEPDWEPLPSGEVPELDPSDFRKQRIEDELAGGTDL